MKNQLRKISVGLGSLGLFVVCLFLVKPTEISAAAKKNVMYLTYDLPGDYICTGPRYINGADFACLSHNTIPCTDLNGCDIPVESDNSL